MATERASISGRLRTALKRGKGEGVTPARAGGKVAAKQLAKAVVAPVKAAPVKKGAAPAKAATPAKKAAPARAGPAKAAAKAAPASKAAAPVKKAAAAKAAPATKAAPAKAAPANKVPAKKGPAKKVPAAKAAPAKKAPAAKVAPVKKAPAKATALKGLTKSPVRPPHASAPQVRSTVAPMKKAAPATKPHRAPLTGDDAWTRKELADVRTALEAHATSLRGEIDEAEEQRAALKRDSGGEGTGDEADAGSKTFEREHEMSLANNSRDLLLQVERALSRVEDRTYGRCENCGNPIPKARLQALPAATMCVACKQREERR